jgi:hypothetical protein
MKEDQSQLLDVIGPAYQQDLGSRQLAVDLFVARLATHVTPSSPPSRSRPMIVRLLAGKLATATLAGAVGLGGTTAAAYAGVLPEPLQEVAHTSIGAPAPAESTGDPAGPSSDEPATEPVADPADAAESGGDTTSEPTDGAGEPASGTDGDSAEDPDPLSSAPGAGPAADGPAKHGLCTAYAAGGLSQTSVAYRNLKDAAEESGGIGVFCADVLKPTGKDGTDADGTEDAEHADEPADSTSGGDEVAEKTAGKTTTTEAKKAKANAKAGRRAAEKAADDSSVDRARHR